MLLPRGNPARAVPPLGRRDRPTAVALRRCALLLACLLPGAAFAQTPADSAVRLAEQAAAAEREGTRPRFERAILLWSQAAALLGRVGDRRSQAVTLHHIGVVWTGLKQPDSALASYRQSLTAYRQALAIKRAASDRVGLDSLLFQIGLAHLLVHQPDSTLWYYEQAAVVMRAGGDRRGERTLLSLIASAHSELGRTDSALIYYWRALALDRALGDRAGEASALDEIAMMHEDLEQPDSALAYFRQALAIERALADRKGERGTLESIARVWKAIADSVSEEVTDSAAALAEQAKQASHEGTREALERSARLWTQAATLLHGSRDRVHEGTLLYNLGGVYLSLKRPDAALAAYGRALAIARQVDDRAGESVTLSYVGRVQETLGQRDSALASYRQELAIERELGDSAGEGTALNNIGTVYLALGHPDSALVYLRAALSRMGAPGDRAHAATLLDNIGSVQMALALPDSALASFRRALVIRRAVGDRSGEGRTLNNIGGVHDNIGEPDSALADYQEALAMARAQGDRLGEGATLANLGSVRRALGQVDSALAYYRLALGIEADLGNRAAEGKLLNNIAAVNNDVGRPDSALAYYRRALETERAAGERASEGKTLSNIGGVHMARREPDSALTYFRQGVAIERAVRDREGEGSALNNIGFVYAALGWADSAITDLSQALTIERAVGDRAGEAQTLGNLGSLFQRNRSPPDLARAVAYYDSAAAVEARVAAHAGGEANRVTFGELGVRLFETWTLAWLARAPEVGPGASALAALAASERGRAQALLELTRRTTTAATPGRDLVAEGTRLVAAGARGGVGVLSYLVTADTVVVWVVVSGQAPDVTRRAVARDSLAAAVRSLRGALGVGEAEQSRVALPSGGPLDAGAPAEIRGAGVRQASAGSAEVLSRDVARLLLPPELDRKLGAVHELVIVPHGVVGLVPFAALPVDTSGTPLGSRYALRYVPSLAVLSEVAGRVSTPAGVPPVPTLRQSLVVGNPAMPTTSSAGMAFALSPLPGAATEAEEVAMQLGATALTGTQATEVEVRRRLPTAPVVHLATHGYAYATDARARQSFVALASGAGDDGFLTVGEVVDDPALTLSANLVVLSACQTGLGDLKQAEGTVGFQRAFLARGARSVLVSLWNVSDAATALLMRGFYQHWLADTDHPSKAEALRRAEEAVRADPRFAAPRYWAAFQLVGAP